MSILIDVASELFGMFVTDLRLTLGVLILVAAVALLIGTRTVDPLSGGGLLLAGSLAILVSAVVREAKGMREAEH